MENPGFNLGSAIFGQEGHPQVPDVWRALLIRRLGVVPRRTWFRTCRAGRDSILRTAQWLTITLRLTTPALHSVLAAVRDALHTRGQHSRTILHIPEAGSDATQLMLLPQTLAAAGQFVTRLSIDPSVLRQQQPQFSSAFLAAAATAMPNITALDVGTLNSPLPDPALLPHLTNLTATISCSTSDATRAACASVAPLMPQLKYLLLNRVQPGRWGDVFSAATSSHTLKSFSTDSELTDELLGCLIQHTPALEKLAVTEVVVVSDLWRDLDWKVREVAIQEDAGAPHAQLLSQLPLSRRQRLFLEANTLVFVAEDGLGLSAEVRDRLPTWQLKPLAYVVLVLSPQLTTEQQQAAAIRASVQQLAGLDTPLLYEVWFEDFMMADSVLQAITTAMATWLPRSKASLSIGHLGSEAADLLLQHAPHASRLQVDSMQLFRNHSDRTRSWQAIDVMHSNFQVNNMMHIPGPARPTDSLHVTLVGHTAFQVYMTPLLVAAGGVQRLRSRFLSVWFTHKGTPIVSVVCPPNAPPQEQPALLHACLEVCQAMRMDALDWELQLRGWTLTTEVMAELQGLPTWGWGMDLTHCQWAVEADVSCFELARVVPAQYREWWLLSALQEHVLDIVDGVAMHTPPGRAARKLTLRVADHPWVPVVSAHVEELGLSGRVTVVAQTAA